MSDTTTVPSVVAQPGQSPVQEAEFAVLAKCVIRVGEVCTVYFPDHHDTDSYRDHLRYHEQNAVVVAIQEHGSGIDIRITTGPAKGTLSENVNPMNLFFWGPFVPKTDVSRDDKRSSSSPVGGSLT